MVQDNPAAAVPRIPNVDAQKNQTTVIVASAASTMDHYLPPSCQKETLPSDYAHLIETAFDLSWEILTDGRLENCLNEDTVIAQHK